MTNIYDIQERRDSIELNRHLDTQGMTTEEEIAFENSVDAELDNLVEDALLDITSDELIEALISNPELWSNFIECVPCTDRAYSIDEAQQALRFLNIHVQKLIDGVEGSLRKSLRCVAEENVK